MNDSICPYKKFYRSKKERMIAGVCGGLGEHFSIDPVWIRTVFVLTGILGGSGILIYLILWALVPIVK